MHQRGFGQIFPGNVYNPSAPVDAVTSHFDMPVLARTVIPSEYSSQFMGIRLEANGCGTFMFRLTNDNFVLRQNVRSQDVSMDI